MKGQNDDAMFLIKMGLLIIAGLPIVVLTIALFVVGFLKRIISLTLDKILKPFRREM